MKLILILASLGLVTYLVKKFLQKNNQDSSFQNYEDSNPPQVESNSTFSELNNTTEKPSELEETLSEIKPDLIEEQPTNEPVLAEVQNEQIFQEPIVLEETPVIPKKSVRKSKKEVAKKTTSKKPKIELKKVKKAKK